MNQIDAPQALAFSELGLSAAMLAAVQDMGYERPTPVQAASIPEVLAGRDLLAAAQTGTGKTAAFLLPTLDRLPQIRAKRGQRRVHGAGPRMLVITPTRELAQQIDGVCRQISAHTGHRALTVVGGVSYNPQRSALQRGCDVLIATPGRLEDLIQQGAANLDEVQVLVLDEADRMLDMGFLPTVRRIVKTTPDDRQTLLFSATLDDAAVGSITDLVREPARVEIAPATSTAETVDQYVLPVSLEAKNGLITQVLHEFGASHVIVFCRTKRRADTVCRRLSRSGFSAAAIHGDRSQAQRERALRAFRDGRVDVLVATDVLARGIDVSDVSYVINFDVPEEPVDYIHRIGRTGRAGEEGWSVTFVTEQDIEDFFDIEALMGKTADLFSLEDRARLNLGEHPVFVDPARVPRDRVASKQEKKRRRDRIARKLAAKYGDDLPAGVHRRVAGSRKHIGKKDGGASVSQASSRHRRVSDEELAEASKPSRRKRSGRVRVREEEPRRSRERGASVDDRAAAKERIGRSRQRAGQKNRRVSEQAPYERGSLNSHTSRHRAKNRFTHTSEDQGSGKRSHKGSNRRGDNSSRGAERRGSHDWRNHDAPDERRGRRGGSPSQAAQTPTRRKRLGRRPGDGGGSGRR
ncbi:DEAD/DEAH box helicase [Collinsella sp. AGMB00827]|uniref:DEAD/DEAH box helicase n=1 Tax=Collinsella ureilytica TaxID=2869515 RepID=A0ABS7MIK0_9ACTN|nr:DEAD/DEAH box helicase [Collinsella urealyticum]MBY4797077.1 DEAD/DEAH box helicase [Collinsella urealyticum]